jgi:hypothetical protein
MTNGTTAADSGDHAAIAPPASAPSRECLMTGGMKPDGGQLDGAAATDLSLRLRR